MSRGFWLISSVFQQFQFSISAISLAKDTTNPTHIVSRLRSRIGIRQILTCAADFFTAGISADWLMLMLYLLTITWLTSGCQLTMYRHVPNSYNQTGNLPNWNPA